VDAADRGAGPLRQRTRARTAGRVLLVGDASGYVDALTGEGLRLGFAQAVAAVAHLDDPAGYERAWAAATRDYRLLTSTLVAVATSPLRGALVPAAVRLPPVFAGAVERLAR
jgi:flavin-dependent dehydrogenase